MRIRSSVAILAATLLAAVSYGQGFAHARPLPEQQHRQALFGTQNTSIINSVHQQATADMSVPYMFDSDAKGPPALSDILAKEKGASIAMDAIMRSESLVRAISGDSADFAQGLTLLLPTNKAFLALSDIPDDIDLVMKRHFIPQAVTPQAMEQGTTVFAYQRSAALRFTSSQGRVYVQADKRAPTAVHGAGVQAGTGAYFLVDELFV